MAITLATNETRTVSNVFCYIRVSTEEQAEGASLKEQRRVIEGFCERRGLRVAGHFEDVETAAKAGRKQFDFMVKELRTKKSDGVVFHKVDRSSRNYRDWLTVSDLMDAGIYVAFAAEGLESKDPAGRFTMDILAATAVHYIRNLRQEVIKGMHGRVRDGQWPGRAPVGYLDAPPGTLAAERCIKPVDSERAPLVHRMFELYATGEYTLERLADEMDRAGLRTQGGKSIKWNRIGRVLDNPFYVGLIRFRGELFPGKHEPIITAALWEKVQRLRSKTMHAIRTVHDHRFKQLLSCGYCGRTLTPEVHKDYTYYRCHSRGHEVTCVREEAVEEAALRDFLAVKLSPEEKEVVHAVLKDMTKDELRLVEQERQRLQLLRNQAAGQGKKAVDAFLRGVMDEDTYKQAQADLAMREKDIENQLDALVQRSPLQGVADLLEQFELLYFAYSTADTTKRRQIIRSAYSNLVVNTKNVSTKPKEWIAAALNREKFLHGGREGI
ncbi:recombinase family protein [Candidatus Falkowbacteria bacterium]|nr:recombinase family protein [Candidatus Falkowbacteria bacterium]